MKEKFVSCALIGNHDNNNATDRNFAIRMSEQYRADLPAWILIGGLSNFPWLIVWGDAGLGIHFTDLLIAIIATALAFAWLISFRIVITPTELIFRSLFRGKRSIKHDEIKKVRLVWNFRQTIRPAMQLIVEPREGKTMKELTINAKVFSRAAINAVLDLGTRVAEADDAGLRDGIVLKTLRDRKQRKKYNSDLY
jgi:hypothetical protein